MANIERKTVAITGANRGIGRAMAENFAAHGHSVVALVREPKAMSFLSHTDCVAIAFDASDSSSVHRAAAALLPLEIDILINNAGIVVSAPLKNLDDETLQRMMQVNVMAPIQLMRSVVPMMQQRQSGRIINIASTAALKGFAYSSAYCASKHALLGATRALALELATQGITVNAICPGWTETDMLQQSVTRIASKTNRSEAEAKEVLRQLSPQKRSVLPQEVASLAYFLACDDAAKAMTGGAYVIDGGETA